MCLLGYVYSLRWFSYVADYSVIDEGEIRFQPRVVTSNEILGMCGR